MSENLELIFSENNSWGRATLNVPASLNSLTLNMVETLYKKFSTQWHQEAHNVKAIF